MRISQLIGSIHFNRQKLYIRHILTHKEYDELHNYQIKGISGIKALKFLIEQKNLKQSDLSEIEGQGVVSEILSGKRQLNLNQIKKLSERFHVSDETLIELR